MRLTIAVALMAGAGMFGSASAQIYKWTDSRGVTHYSDTPASSQAIAVGVAPPAPALLSLPYELAQAARKHPVTLYSTTGCAVCDHGRALLKARGIPFTEKTVTSDADEARLRDAGGDGSLPLLLVGRSKLVGFEAVAWQGALDAAAYPRRSMLPKAYRWQSASAADPVATAAAAAPVPAQAESAAAPSRRKDNTLQQERSALPPGFQF
jgi:glutaredoxin